MLAACVSLIPMVAHGMITAEILIWTAACMPVLLLGSALGSWRFRHAKPRHHRLVALTTLSVLAVLLIARAGLGSWAADARNAVPDPVPIGPKGRKPEGNSTVW